MTWGTYIRICLLGILSLSAMQSCYKESITEEPAPWNITGRILAFDHVYAFCDREDHLLLYHLSVDSLRAFSPVVSFGEYHSVEFNGIELLENVNNKLGDIVLNQAYTVKVRKGKEEESYQL